VSFIAGPNQDAVLIFRVLPGAAGNDVRTTITSLQATNGEGQEVSVSLEGQALTRIRPRP
jgi:hypothetical protein